MPDVCGDQNGDELITIQDVIIDAKISVDPQIANDAQNKLSDLDRDNDVDIDDANIGLRHIVGIIPALTECGPP